MIEPTKIYYFSILIYKFQICINPVDYFCYSKNTFMTPS